MNMEKYFGKAIWVGAKERTREDFFTLHSEIDIREVKKATLFILGLGFFKCFINGKCINPDTFLPLSSDFEGGCDPSGEVLSGHRVYVPSFDVTSFLKNGINSMDIHFGGGWYTCRERCFGLPKAIYRLVVKTDVKEEEFVSDESLKIRKSFVSEYNFTRFETHDLAMQDSYEWENAVATETLDTEYCDTSCMVDALIKELSAALISKDDKRAVYDCGENTVGYPVISVKGEKGDTVTVRFAEEILSDGTLDMTHSHSQKFTVICDGSKRVVQPEFTWFGFRFFEIEGNAEPLFVKVVHSDVKVSSEFESDNETLNWIYKTFINTMLCNMHTGHPSDCPHIERRGYTGDGQLTAHAALTVFDARDFYEKWLRDIADSQDTLSGHIQYTAPYIRSGGGPGGWGCAIVEVPYQLYKHFGDTSVLSEYYHNMVRYIDYLEAHSEFGLVTSDKAGEWCLGDWCGPNILYPDRDITSHNQQVILPAPMVNTYFMIKSLTRMCEIAGLIGKEDDIPLYKEKIETRKRAVRAAYYNTFDGNFVMNVQGANAYAVDIGVGGASTYKNMVRYYTRLGYFDTGIFATDILTRVLFEKGDGVLALSLMTNDGNQGYEHWRKNGATTFHEYWDSNRSRSHNHPMFGAPVAYLFEHILGIGQEEGSAGYRSVVIEPKALGMLGRVRGSISTSLGRISVSYEKKGSLVNARISLPSGIKATFRYGEYEKALSQGENIFEISPCEE